MAVPTPASISKNGEKTAAHSSRKWIVLGACFTINFLSSALLRNAALFYPSIMDTFLVSREKAALPLFVYGGCFHLGALLGGAVIHVLTVGPAAVVGGLLLSATFIASSFATGTVFLAVILGILGGTGQGIIFNCSVVGLGDHFASWRGLALGVVMTGAPAASFLFPSLFHCALEGYGLRGTLLLTGACMINVPLFGFLLHQRKVPNNGKAHNRKCPGDTSEPKLFAFAKEETRKTEQCSVLPHLGVETDPANDKQLHSHRTISSKRAVSFGSSDAKLMENGRILKGIPKGVSLVPVPSNIRLYSENISACTWPTRVKTSRRTTAADLHDLIKLSIPVLLLESKNLKSLLGEVHNQQQCTSELPKHISRWSALAKSARTVISTPRFYVTAYAFYAYCFFLDTYLTVIVDYCMDSGVAETDAVHILSFFSITDVLCRLVIPFLTDKRLLSTPTTLALSYLLASLLAASLPFLKERIGFWTVAFILGLPCGYINVGLSDYLTSVAGEENLPMALGFMSAAAVVGSFTTPSLIGAFRDTWGSYNGLFFFIAGALMIGFGLFAGLLTMDFFKRKTFLVSRQ